MEGQSGRFASSINFEIVSCMEIHQRATQQPIGHLSHHYSHSTVYDTTSDTRTGEKVVQTQQ